MPSCGIVLYLHYPNGTETSGLRKARILLSGIGDEVTELRSVGNALRAILELAEADGPLAVTELARRLEVAPSTAYRLLATLVAHGFAVQVPALRQYRAGPALSRLGRKSLLDDVRLREAGRPVLERLAAQTGETT